MNNTIKFSVDTQNSGKRLDIFSVSYTHLRAHETEAALVCRLLLEKRIEEKILRNEDIFGRGIKLKKINLDESYPKFIVENREKFADWII